MGEAVRMGKCSTFLFGVCKWCSILVCSSHPPGPLSRLSCALQPSPCPPLSRGQVSGDPTAVTQEECGGEGFFAQGRIFGDAEEEGVS